jgi:hypothetical protein
MLSRVKIYFENGNLGGVSPSDDAVVGLLASAVAVTGKFELSKAYQISSLADLANLGVTDSADDVNISLYKAVYDFYNEAPNGTYLWIYGVAKTVTMADMLDKTKPYFPALITAANGAINFVMVAKADPSAYTATIATGLDADCVAAITKAQEACEWATTDKYAPCFALLEGRHYSGTATDLPDLTTRTDNRVGVVIGDTVSGSVAASVGTIAGRLAAVPVQRKASRVKTGALNTDLFYIGSVAAENGNPDVIDGKGFITFRTITGKSGYFVAEDRLATADSDDYAVIPRRRVIDKAYRIAYKTLVEELQDEVPVTSEGYMPHSSCKSIQNQVETAIENSMTVNKNLGTDPDDPTDTGVKCYINPKQNIVSGSEFGANLSVKPYGYKKYINVYLGFKTSLTD